MPTELLRDKRANVENRLNNAKVELFLAEQIATLADEPLPADADDITKAAYMTLRTEAESAKVNVIALRRKVAVWQPLFDTLDAELQSEAAGAPQ